MVSAPPAEGRELFTATHLEDWVGDDVVDPARAAMAERVVWGWLQPLLNVDTRPNPLPDKVFSWAIELGAIAYENPNGLHSYQLGEERTQYSAERRNEVLRLAASGGTTTDTDASPAPVASFPPPLPEPSFFC